MKSFSYRIVSIKEVLITVLYASIIILLTHFISDSEVSIQDIGISILIISCALIFLRNYKRHLVRYQFDTSAFQMHSLLGFKKSILFEEVKRVIVREELDFLGIKYQAMTIYANGGSKIKIRISDLQEENLFTEKIKEAMSPYQAKLIYQDVNGKVL